MVQVLSLFKVKTFQIEIDEDKYLETVLRIDLLYMNLKYGKLKRPVRNTRWSCQRFPTGFDVDYSPRENIFSKKDYLQINTHFNLINCCRDTCRVTARTLFRQGSS